VQFATPVPVTAGVTYVASYHAPRGGYAATASAFATAEHRRPPCVRPPAPMASTATAPVPSPPAASAPPTTGSTCCSHRRCPSGLPSHSGAGPGQPSSSRRSR
jgi:hypothetical protein